MGPHGDPRSPLLKTTQKAIGFLQPILPPCILATLTAASGYGGQHWDFMDFESYHTPHSLAELVPRGRGKPFTRETATYQEIPTHRDIKSQGMARELKELVIQSYLVENNRKTLLYQSTREMHSYIDAKIKREFIKYHE